MENPHLSFLKKIILKKLKKKIKKLEIFNIFTNSKKI